MVCETSDQGVSYEADYDFSDDGGEFLDGVGVGGYGEGECGGGTWTNYRTCAFKQSLNEIW